MTVERSGWHLARPGDRRILRAALALGAATMIGGVAVPTANADMSAAPTSAAFSAAEAAVDSDAEIEAIEQLKASYFRNVDAKDWAALRDLLAPNVVVDTTGSLGPIFYGRDSFVAFLALTLGALDTHHQGYDPQITLTSPTTAEVVWTMEDRLVFLNIIGVHGYGHYTDRYEKVGDTWVIEYSKLTRTRIDLIFPVLDRFLTTLAQTWQSEGPVAALHNAIAAIFGVSADSAISEAEVDASTVDSPTNAATTNAATTDTATTNAAVTDRSAASLISAPASTADVPAADAARSAVEPVEAGDAEVPAEKQAEPVTTVDRAAEAGEQADVIASAPVGVADDATAKGAGSTGSIKESSRTPRDSGDSASAADVKGNAEPDVKPSQSTHRKTDVKSNETADDAKPDVPDKTA